MQLSHQKREQVADFLHQGLGRNEIARRAEVSPATVGKIAREEGVTFDRSKMVEATKIASADARYKRQMLASNLLGDIESARMRLAQQDSAAGFRFVAQGLDALVRSYATIQSIDGTDREGFDEARGILVAFAAQVQQVHASQAREVTAA